jgi:Tol biopolymer transport system component
MRKTLTLTIGALLLLSTALMGTQTANDLFQQGLQKERADGDIAAAIKIYERIVREFPSNRPLTAKALVQLGICYEQLGEAKAREYFQQVVTKFSDQPETAAEARKRLAPTLSEPIRIAAPLPPGPEGRSFAISPDGQSLVFQTTVSGRTSLWVWRINSGKHAPIRGTESSRYGSGVFGANPFWSPDSRSIGYFEDGRLKTISVDGGTPKILADAPLNVGGAWSPGGVIVFGPNSRSPLYRVPAEGGEVTPASALDSRTLFHRYPHFLPDGQHFLFFSASYGSSADLLIDSLDSLEAQSLHAQVEAATFLPPDRLVFASRGALYSQSLDLQQERLMGEPIRLAESVLTFTFNDRSPVRTGFGYFSASTTGRIAYRASDEAGRQLLWFDRMGTKTSAFGQTLFGVSGSPRFSPDGRVVALKQGSQALVLELGSAVQRYFELGAVSFVTPVWSPDSDSLAFGDARDPTRGMAVADIYTLSVDRIEEPHLLLGSAARKSVLDWHNEFLLYGATAADNSGDNSLVVSKLNGDEQPIPVAAAPFSFRQDARFSPDGRWIAYQGDLDRAYEIFVQPFPGSAADRKKISINGGNSPQWRRDGKELYFLSPDNHLMVVPVRPPENGEGISFGRPQPVFPNPLPPGSTYAPAPDGERFLVSVPVEETPPIIVLSNVTGAKQPAQRR